MKLQFQHQKFQEEAARAVVDVFAGQPFRTASHRFGRENGVYQTTMEEAQQDTVWGNQELVPELSDGHILEQIREVQNRNGIAPSAQLEGRYNLTIEMETGVGKTYTYIKTIYELNRHYGWSKYIIVVPSIAIREGVYRTLEVTEEHFAREYGKKIRFFIYNSARLQEIGQFASDPSIHVMIINAQAFNARGKDARRIYSRLDEFQSRRPIDVIAGTRPILIIDEPQSVEGKQTKRNLEEFHPLISLRYSATHRSDSIYNMVYRLDAVEAYNRKLVKKIAVKGISESGSTATDGYVYLEGIQLSQAEPAAIIRFDCRGKSGIRQVTRKVGIGFRLYEHSGHLEEYRDNFVVTGINGGADCIEFGNGIRLYSGEVIGNVSEEQLRRIQIRETILSHIERERQLFLRGIKVLSLFFLDEVEHYRMYDEAGQAVNGIYADMFEEEYRDIVGHLSFREGEEAYRNYLNDIGVHSTHAGYFSIDRKGRMVNSQVKRKETSSEDADAYDLIMKKKELLLDRDPNRSPVRFLFSHSALREGWDNPNVFQICTLKQSGSDIRKRQEVGRGMRLCVREDGIRMDEAVLGSEVHQVNLLTVIASESYESFARGLQAEIAEAVGLQPGETTAIQVENARSSSVKITCDREKLNSRAFQELWKRIGRKAVYTVAFDTDELVKRAVAALDEKLQVPGIFYRVETGTMEQIRSKEELLLGKAFSGREAEAYRQTEIPVSRSVRYDLPGCLAEETGLTRKAIVQILTQIAPEVFEQFRGNPEAFLLEAARLINEEKAAGMLRHISYEPLQERFGIEVFTGASMRGKPGGNAVRTEKHLFDYVRYDSERELLFARELEASREVEVYVKLPDGFFLSTPVGRYHPDWAIAFRKEEGGWEYCVAETKGSMDERELRGIERAKIHCAREHFAAVGEGEVRYEVVDSYQALLKKRMSRDREKTSNESGKCGK